MTSPTPSRAPMAGGFLLALGIVAGAVTGSVYGQTTIGFFAGLGVGVALMGAIWLRERGR